MCLLAVCVCLSVCWAYGSVGHLNGSRYNHTLNSLASPVVDISYVFFRNTLLCLLLCIIIILLMGISVGFCLVFVIHPQLHEVILVDRVLLE